MQHPCPLQSIPFPHLKPPENSFKLLKIDMQGKYDLINIFLPSLSISFACEHNLKMLLKYGAPLPGIVHTWSHLKSPYNSLKVIYEDYMTL